MGLGLGLGGGLGLGPGLGAWLPLLPKGSGYVPPLGSFPLGPQPTMCTEEIIAVTLLIVGEFVSRCAHEA